MTGVQTCALPIYINTIVGNGKRFIAYELVERLKRAGFHDLLESLSSWVNSTDRSLNKKHEVFEPSFDWKECNDERLVEQKLSYISFPAESPAPKP